MGTREAACYSARNRACEPRGCLARGQTQGIEPHCDQVQMLPAPEDFAVDDEGRPGIAHPGIVDRRRDDFDARTAGELCLRNVLRPDQHGHRFESRDRPRHLAVRDPRRHQVVAGGSIVLQAVALALLSTLFLQRSEYYRISSLAHLGSVFDAGFSAGRSNKIAVD